MDYETIKTKVDALIEPSTAELKAAIKDQKKRLAAMTDQLSLQSAKLAASAFHPWPIPLDQENRVIRRAISTTIEHDKLTELYFWTELQANNIEVKAEL
jgi:hypothetical protein